MKHINGNYESNTKLQCGISVEVSAPLMVLFIILLSSFSAFLSVQETPKVAINIQSLNNLTLKQFSPLTS